MNKNSLLDFLFITVAVLLFFNSMNQKAARKVEAEQLSQQILNEIAEELSVDREELYQDIIERVIKEIKGEKTISEDLIKEIVEDAVIKIKEDLPEPPILPDYDSLKDLKQITLIKDFESWTPKGEIQENKVTDTIINEKGELAGV